jgi:hypothetical protein
MRYVVWALAVVAFVLMVYFVVDFARHRQSAPKLASLSTDIGPDSVATYEQRIVDLKASSTALKERLGRLGTVSRPDVQERMRLFDAEIANFERAVAEWKAEHNRAGQGEDYRQCILLYGKASGVCQSLAPDTILAKGGK